MLGGWYFRRTFSNREKDHAGVLAIKPHVPSISWEVLLTARQGCDCDWHDQRAKRNVDGVKAPWSICMGWIRWITIHEMNEGSLVDNWNTRNLSCRRFDSMLESSSRWITIVASPDYTQLKRLWASLIFMMYMYPLCYPVYSATCL